MKVTDEISDEMIATCKSTVERLTKAMPRETDEQKMQLGTILRLLEQAFIAGVNADRQSNSSDKHPNYAAIEEATGCKFIRPDQVPAPPEDLVEVKPDLDRQYVPPSNSPWHQL